MNTVTWTVLIGFVICVLFFVYCLWTVYDWMKKKGKKDYFLGRK